MSRIKKILLAVLIVLIAIQFIQPAHNKSKQLSPADMSIIYIMPVKVQAVLKAACYNCHSNNTNYPWYANVQPMAWFLASHIKEGKAELNFNEFGNYSSRRQMSKLKAIENSINDGTMPLASYRWMHKEARLSADEKTMITNWIAKVKDSLTLRNE